jgi:RNA polymerase sigma factor (sigma-70 family)
MQRQSTNGHRRSEEALFRQHHQRLVTTLQRRLGVSRELAEDAVAFAWMQLVRKSPDHGDPIAWVYVVAKHEAFALIRAARRSELIEEIDSNATAPPPARVVEGRWALALLGRLKPQQRTVLRLRVAGLTYGEICQLTGRTYTWVNRHVVEGRRALRRLIEGDEP